ncbi:MAG: sulfotransferase [Aureliella sp.]
MSAWGEPSAPDELGNCSQPVFIFGSGWHSGSTLMQRLCMPPCLIWGEPYGQAWLLEHLTAPMRALSKESIPDWYFHDGCSLEELTERYVAHLCPSPKHLRSAYRSFIEQLLAEPARATASRWGAMFVRGTSEHAAFLKWLYPDCRLVFVVRNPYDCLQDWATWRQTQLDSYDLWPARRVTASVLAQTWHRNTTGFLKDHLELGAKLVRYEELAEGQFDDIEEHLGFPLHRRAAEMQLVGGPQESEIITEAEKISFKLQVETLAAELGYTENRPEGASAPTAATNVLKPHAGKGLSPDEVCVLVPVSGAIAPACENNLRALEKLGYTVRRVPGFSAIDQARNVLASAAMRDGFAATLWIDSDVAFEPSAVEKLRQHNLPVVCGIYPKKRRRELACHVLPGTDAVLFGQAGGLIEIKYAGAGFLYVRREVYHDVQHRLNLPLCNEQFGEAVVPYFQPMIVEEEAGKRWYLAEDYAFCERVRRCGYSIMADTTIRLWHIGTHEYSWEDTARELPRFATFKLNLRGGANES